MKTKCPHCGGVINPAALLGAKTSAAKAASSRANAKLGGWPKGKPRKPKRWDSERGEYVQIGSFAGPDAVKNAEERIAEDKLAQAI
jgi:hypothetical protein